MWGCGSGVVGGAVVRWFCAGVWCSSGVFLRWGGEEGCFVMVSDDEAGLGGGKGERYVFDGRTGGGGLDWRW